MLQPSAQLASLLVLGSEFDKACMHAADVLHRPGIAARPLDPPERQAVAEEFCKHHKGRGNGHKMEQLDW
jgi:hypothetical protein